MHQYKQVLARLRAGDTVRQIARDGLMGRDKATRLREVGHAQGWLDPDKPLPEEAAIAQVLGGIKRAASTVSSLEPWREQISAWIDSDVSGTVMHATLCRNHGYTGSYSSVARMVSSIRGARQPDTTVRLHFKPGEAAQVDFGAGPIMVDANGERRRTWAFVMTLCFSRHQYVEFIWDQSVTTWLGCHRRAFEWFNGVPGRVIIDNAKCAIIKACANDPLVQRAYGECAIGYGFKIDPCPPYDPQKKGIVESGVKYVKNNFLALRQYRDQADLNAQVRQWVMDTAGRRNHGTTHKAPLALFELERDVLSPLPDIAPDLGSWHRATVHRDCHVQFDKAFYSVSFKLVKQRLWLRATDCSVALYKDYEHLHTHPRALRRGQRVTVADHLPPNAVAFFAHDRQWCIERAAQIGPACAALIAELLNNKILEKLRTAQNILRLAKTYGATRLNAACQRALTHNAIGYGTVKSILAGGYDKLESEHYTEQPYASGARFARDADDLFTEHTAQPGRLH